GQNPLKTRSSRRLKHPDFYALLIAESAVRWDDQFWIEDERGWKDGRLLNTSMNDKRTTWSWCNGRAVALLARAAVANALGREFKDQRICAALYAPETDVLKTASPGLCCGTSGVVDAFIELYSRYPIEQFLEKATHATSLIIEKTPRSQL